MATTVWEFENKLLVDASQNPIECSHCICCPVLLSEMIYERQKAAGMAAGLINPGQRYYVVDIKTYVNAVAPYYVDDPYSGGASPPAMLTSSYADAATTCAGLDTLVRALLRTVESASYAETESKSGSSTNESSCADAKSNAGWAVNGTVGRPYAAAAIYNGTYQWVWGWGSCQNEDVLFAAAHYASKGKYSATGLYTSLNHTVAFYVKPEKASPTWSGGCPTDLGNVFNKNGRSIPNENTWGSVWTSGAVATATVESDELFNTNEPAWPECPASTGVEREGFHVPASGDDNQLSVILWAFTET